MKRNRIVFTAAGILMLSVLFTGCAAKKQPFGFQALKINGRFVDVSIFNQEYQRFFENNRRNALVMRTPDDERRAEVLDTVIEREIVENYLTNRRDIEVTDKEVTDFLNRYVKPSMCMNINEDDPVLLSIQDVVVSQQTFSSIKSYLLSLKIIPEIAAKYNIKADPKEVKKEYKRQFKDNYLVLGRHIVLPKWQIKLSGELAEKMKKETDIGDLVRKYSIDPYSKNKGGAMGNIALAAITPDFAKKMRTVRPGEILGPYQVSYGIEIIRIDDVIHFNHPENEIEKTILMKNFHSSPVYQDWVGSLKAGVNIEITDPVLKAYYFFKTGKYAEAAPLFIKLYQSGKSRDALDLAAACFKKAGDGEELVRWSGEGIRTFPGFSLNYYLSQASGFMMLQKTNECLLAMKNAEKAAGGQILKEIADQYFELGLTNEGSKYTNRR